MLGADADRMIEAEPREFGVEIAMFVRVHFVDDEDDRLVDAAQAAGEFGIDRREAILAIDDEEDHLRGLQGQLDLGVDLLGELASTSPPMPPVSMTVNGCSPSLHRRRCGRA